MPDPRRVFEDKDMAGAVLYAKRLSSDASDAWPVLVDEAGNLRVNITTGTVSLSSTASVITNSSSNAVNVTEIVGRTLTGSTGSLSATNGTISVAGSNRIKVYAFSLTTTSATEVTCVFHTGGLELWRVTLQAPSGANSGANLAVAPPSFLFASRSATAVSLSLSTAVMVHYSISYFDEA